MPAIDELRKLVIDQKKASLPFQVEDERLRPLHEAIHAFDQVVSQVVIEAMQGRQAPDITSEVRREHQQEAHRQLAAISTVDNRSINLYRAYLERLDRMLSLTWQVFSDPSEPDRSGRNE